MERVLKDPDEIYIENKDIAKVYYMFYRLFDEKYILAVVKVIDTGAYFASMYLTGEDIRTSHQKLKKLKL